MTALWVDTNECIADSGTIMSNVDFERLAAGECRTCVG